MTIGNWDPAAEQASSNFQLDHKLLTLFLSLSDEQQLEQLPKLLDAKQQQLYAAVMRTEKNHWFTLADSFNDQDIEKLIRFFTVAEKLPGWEAGETSPVIWLGKILKKRGVGINRELVLWIKAHSDNQYLPHGPLL